MVIRRKVKRAIKSQLGITVTSSIDPAIFSFGSPQTSVPSDTTDIISPIEPYQDRSVEEASPLTSSSTTIRSNKPRSDCRFSLTGFNGFTGTSPVIELHEVGWGEACSLLCPANLKILSDKKYGIYVVPCILKVAPLVANTLEAAQKAGTTTVGKMRSKNHVTVALLLIIDLDGLSEEKFNVCLERLKADGITYLAYTTFSHGSPEKPGVRARLVIPMDRAVSIEEYSAAWHGFDNHYLNGQASKADSSGANMYQQQGTQCCHPERVHLAQSWQNDAGVASADALIELGQIESVPQTVPKLILRNNENFTATSRAYPASDANKVADACQQIRAFRDSKSAGQSEPLWFNCLGVTVHCQDGEEISHDWSSGHSDYTETETTNKIAHRIKTPPTTCQQFRRTNPDGCRGCMQRCHSPITLGWEKQDALTAMQLLFALIKLDGKIFLIDGSSLDERTDKGHASKLVVFKMPDGKLLIMRALTEQYPNDDASKIANEFFLSPNTVIYNGVDFNPMGTSHRYLNLWVGPTIIPKNGNWQRIHSFLLDIICNGDHKAYRYLLMYLAHALQRPEEKPGIMINLLGGQGIGKGTMGRVLNKIWSATYLFVSDINKVVGTFNADLERCFVVFLDEALFVGDHKSSDRLKSLVTELTIMINEKFQPSRQISSYHRFIAATNADHFKQTDRDDRRDFTLRVSEARKGDFEYWRELNHEIDHGGVAALVYDLLAMDLTDFNIRNRPMTAELLEQKLHSLDHIAMWWHDCLDRGDLDGCGRWTDFVNTADIIAGVVEFTGGKMRRKPDARIIVKAMQKLCPGAINTQKRFDYGRHRGFGLPSLEQARVEFESYIGGKIEWPDAA